MPGNVLLFANPIAGRGRGGAIAEQLNVALSKRGFEVRSFMNWAGGLTREEIESAGAPVAAISIGGDGTLRSVADRLIRHAAQVGDPENIPPLLVVPLGTANLMGKHLGVPRRMKDVAGHVLNLLDSPRIVRLDVARFGPPGAVDQLFLLMAGIGFDAQIVHRLASVRKGPIDYTSYLFPTALAIKDYRYPSLEVRVDGRLVFGPGPALAFVANVREYGTGIPILPDARSDDGLLDVCVIPCSSMLDLPKILMNLVINRHRSLAGVIYLKGTRVVIDSAEPVPIQVDGEATGHTPVEIDLLPVKLPFIVPMN